MRRFSLLCGPTIKSWSCSASCCKLTSSAAVLHVRLNRENLISTKRRKLRYLAFFFPKKRNLTASYWHNNTNTFRPRIRADDWTLVISATEARDAGTYECSVNTLPKISHTVSLAVKEMAMAVSFVYTHICFGSFVRGNLSTGLPSPRTASSEQADEVDRRKSEKSLGSWYRDRARTCVVHLRTKGIIIWK